MVIAANLAIRFLIELCALAGLAYWGYTAPAGTLAGIALGVAAAALAAVAWGAFVAPRRMVAAAPPALRLAVEVAVIGSAAAALIAAGSRGLGVALAVIWAVNKAILALWYRAGEGAA
jgi:hypothetical protein